MTDSLLKERKEKYTSLTGILRSKEFSVEEIDEILSTSSSEHLDLAEKNAKEYPLVENINSRNLRATCNLNGLKIALGYIATYHPSITNPFTQIRNAYQFIYQESIKDSERTSRRPFNSDGDL